MSNRENKDRFQKFNEEFANDFTPMPSDLNDVTPFTVPIVGGLITRDLVEIGEEMIVDHTDKEDPLKR